MISNPVSPIDGQAKRVTEPLVIETEDGQSGVKDVISAGNLTGITRDERESSTGDIVITNILAPAGTEPKASESQDNRANTSTPEKRKEELKIS